MTIEEECETLRSLPRRQVVDEWSPKFDPKKKYPRPFYLQRLCDVRVASNESQLRICIAHLLTWKDGGIREDPAGTIEVGNFLYSARKVKPRVYSPDTHDGTLGSKGFYDWSRSVMTMERFAQEHIKTIQNTFQLWHSSSSRVMPAFLLHILNPRVFPIFDQHVERARRFFAGLAPNSGSSDITLDDYVAYHQFWVEWIVDCKIDLSSAEYARIKQLDEALWSIGKHLKRRKKSRNKQARRPVEFHSPAISGSSTPPSGSMYTTSSPEFINRVFSYLSSMTQKQAMDRAAQETGLRLPPSYSQYPGSHIDRWRKQGYSNLTRVNPILA